MSSPEDRVQDLWKGAFGQPPPIVGDPALVIATLVGSLPPAPPYGQPDIARGPSTDEGELGGE